jgi:hypothetical protein
MDVLGFLFLANVEFLRGGLALGESVTSRMVSIGPYFAQIPSCRAPLTLLQSQ